MKQLKNLSAIVLSKEQQKKIGGEVSVLGHHYCYCSDGRSFPEPPPPIGCEVACSV